MESWKIAHQYDVDLEVSNMGRFRDRVTKERIYPRIINRSLKLSIKINDNIRLIDAMTIVASSFLNKERPINAHQTVVLKNDNYEDVSVSNLRIVEADVYSNKSTNRKRLTVVYGDEIYC